MLTTTPMEQNEIHFYPALPIELRPEPVGTVGLEPTTRGFADRSNRSLQCRLWIRFPGSVYTVYTMPKRL